MSQKIYKYFSYNVYEHVFSRDGFCGIKCTLPKDYNDPFELFLGVDLDIPTDFLATYQDVVQAIPQHPTSCFSKSPIVTPMWAHYAENQSGFVLEFDSEKIQECFPDAFIDDISYREHPNPSLGDSIARAAVTKKPRHSVWLQQQVLKEAYFSKYSAWSYEQECRLVGVNNYIENILGNEILFLPSSCVTGIIVGSKFQEDRIDHTLEIANSYELEWYKLNIGRSFPEPFMTTQDNNVIVFKDGILSPPKLSCSNCLEPLANNNELCPWCKITSDHQREAAMSNPFRILDHYGQLEGYMEQVRKIEKKRR